MQAPATIGMPIGQVRLLSKRQRAEFVVYHAKQTGFDTLGDTFLAQLWNIPNKHREGSNIACTIIQSPHLQGVRNIIEQDLRFNTYIHAYTRARIEKEVRKLSLNARLKIQAADVTSERFESFLFVSIDIEHRRNASFTRILLRACIDNDTSIITDPDITFANEPLLLGDDMEMN